MKQEHLVPSAIRTTHLRPLGDAGVDAPSPAFRDRPFGVLHGTRDVVVPGCSACKPSCSP